MNVIRKSTQLPDGREISIETGALAKQADGSIILTCGDTKLLATVVARKEIDVDEIPEGGGAKIWLVSTEMAYKVLNLINLLTDQKRLY